MRSYATKEISDWLNITPAYVNSWVRSGWIRPSIKSAEGKRGCDQLWAFDDIVVLSVIKHLLELRFSHQVIGDAAGIVRGGLELNARDKALVVTTGGAYLWGQDAPLRAVFPVEKQYLMVVLSLPDLIADLQIIVAN